MEFKGTKQLLNAKYRIKGSMITGQQICELFNLPEHVVVWRIMQNRRGSKLNAKMYRIVQYLGKDYPAAMLGQMFKIDPQTIWDRWQNGLRGANLVTRSDVQEKHDPEFQRPHQALECDAHRVALVEHHRPLWRQNLIAAHLEKRARENGTSHFCEAKAAKAAMELQQRGCQGAGNGVFIRSSADGIV